MQVFRLRFAGRTALGEPLQSKLATFVDTPQPGHLLRAFGEVWKVRNVVHIQVDQGAVRGPAEPIADLLVEAFSGEP